MQLTEERIRVALDERARRYGPIGLELPAVVERSRQRRRRRRTLRSAATLVAIAVAACGGWAAIDPDDAEESVAATDTDPTTAVAPPSTEAAAVDHDATSEWRCTPPEPGPQGGTMPARLVRALDDAGGLSVTTWVTDWLTAGLASTVVDAERLAGHPSPTGVPAGDELGALTPPGAAVVELTNADGSTERVPTRPCPDSSLRYVAVRLDATLVGVRFLDDAGAVVVELPSDVVARIAVPAASRTMQPVADADRAERWRCSELDGGVVELARDGLTFQAGVVDPDFRWGGPWGGLGDLAAFTPSDVTALRVEFLDGAVVEVPTHPCGSVRYAALRLASPWIHSITLLGDDPTGEGDDVTPPDVLDPVFEEWYWRGVGTDG